MNKTAKKKRILIVAGVLVAAVALFCLVFALYKSEAQYVKNEKGEVYLNKDGQPLLLTKTCSEIPFPLKTA